MKTILILFCAIITLSVSSCSNDNSNPNKNNFDLINLSATLIKNGRISNYQEIAEENLVIDNTSDWEELINQMETGTTDSLNQYNIDFSKQMVIAVFGETRPNTGYSISIPQITEYANNIQVQVTQDSIDSGYEVVNRPFYIVKIPKSDKSVIFE